MPNELPERWTLTLDAPNLLRVTFGADKCGAVEVREALRGVRIVLRDYAPSFAVTESGRPVDAVMIVDPDRYVEEFHKLGAKVLSVHYEACTHLHRTLQYIKSLGMLAGVTLNPHTPVSVLEEIICDADVVMLMSVNPGFGGQKFIENTLDKVRRLKKMIVEKGSNAKIEIDGGVNFETGKQLLDAGADILVAGSFVFGAKDQKATIAGLKNL